MIHKIKALHDEGRGLSIRAISQELGIARNTVRKYLREDEAAIGAAQARCERVKVLDAHRDYIAHLLRSFPRLSSVKIARKLREKVGEVAVSNRSLRRYVSRMKETVASGQVRYYQPVLDMVAGVQCQVDPGELRGVLIGGEERRVYFVVFVLSYSRLSYVGVSFEPLDTERFIRLHDEAFRYFGGLPEECVYDQTKMVVIDEQFRELEVNRRFHEYATTAGFRVHACRGYDPQSKGKVEAGVKYVKQDAFYGERFADEAQLRAHLKRWLDEVANTRTHGSTGRQPRRYFEAAEQAHLKGYLRPACLSPGADELASRKVDKTGLISWKANKYSVPMRYQQGRIGVREQAGKLHVHDLDSSALIATHALCFDKGQVVRNTTHYRDPQQRIQDLEHAIGQQLGEALGTQLCERLRASMPRHYKDQLAGARQVLAAQSELDRVQIAEWATRPGLTAGGLKKRLEAVHQAQTRGRDVTEPGSTPGHTGAPPDLAAYARLGHTGAHKEVTHGTA